MEDNKKKYSQWMINLLLSLLLVAYGFIFNSTINRIEKVEVLASGNKNVLSNIEARLSSIDVNIEWIKNNK